MIAWAVDTGITRNASALARVELIGVDWLAWVWKWQGSQGTPLSIEHTVGPGARRIWERLGRGPMAADGFYAPELKRGLAPTPPDKTHVSLRIQAGIELKDVYGPTRRLVHKETSQRLRVQAIGWTWTGSVWQEDARSGERVIAGLKAVESEHVGGKLRVSLPEEGSSHHDEAVAVMRALWHAGAAPSVKGAPLDRGQPFGSYVADGWTQSPPIEGSERRGWEATFE